MKIKLIINIYENKWNQSKSYVARNGKSHFMISNNFFFSSSNKELTAMNKVMHIAQCKEE